MKICKKKKYDDNDMIMIIVGGKSGRDDRPFQVVHREAASPPGR